jgi:hypothetical protein
VKYLILIHSNPASHAARVPDAEFGEVEVRPVYDLSQWEP